jgi:hypothetical protein
MTGNYWDDDELLAALGRALRARQAVPPDFVGVAKSAFAWHNIDAELARLTYDSVRDSASVLRGRTEEASIRALTFTSAHLTIELEVAEDLLLGQVVPAQVASIRVQPKDGALATVQTDEIGCFSISPIPAGSFRLLCRTAAGVDVTTAWLVL